MKKFYGVVTGKSITASEMLYEVIIEDETITNAEATERARKELEERCNKKYGKDNYKLTIMRHYMINRINIIKEDMKITNHGLAKIIVERMIDFGMNKDLNFSFLDNFNTYKEIVGKDKKSKIKPEQLEDILETILREKGIDREDLT